MQTKDILVLLTNQWADWEAAYAISGLNSFPQYEVKTIAVDETPKVSIGGLRAEIDYAIGNYNNFDNLAMLILPGGFDWQTGRHEKIAGFIKKVMDAKIPVAAICGATIFMGKHGFLDKIKHTGDDLELFQGETGYNGQDFYVSSQIIIDNGIITANETAALEFARAIFGVLQLDSDEELDSWYDNQKHGMVR